MDEGGFTGRLRLLDQRKICSLTIKIWQIRNLAGRGGSACDIGTFEFVSNETPTAVILQTISASSNNTLFIVLAMMMMVGVATAAIALFIRRKQA